MAYVLVDLVVLAWSSGLFVDGAASLANGAESGTVNNLTIGFGENGAASLMGGDLVTPVALDTTRPNRRQDAHTYRCRS